MYLNKKVMLFPPCFRCHRNECNCSNNVLIPNQIGNWCSFIELIKQISQMDDGFYLICEDDVKFDNDHYQNNIIPDFEKKLLETFGSFNKNIPCLIRLAKRDVGSSFIYKPIIFTKDVIMSNACFSINRKFAEVFTKTMENRVIVHTSDVFIHRDILAIDKTIQHFSMYPAPADQLSHQKIYSEIHPKGIDEYDKERMRKHVKRIEYKDLHSNIT